MCREIVDLYIYICAVQFAGLPHPVGLAWLGYPLLAGLLLLRCATGILSTCASSLVPPRPEKGNSLKNDLLNVALRLQISLWQTYGRPVKNLLHLFDHLACSLFFIGFFFFWWGAAAPARRGMQACQCLYQPDQYIYNIVGRAREMDESWHDGSDGSWAASLPRKGKRGQEKKTWKGGKEEKKKEPKNK